MRLRRYLKNSASPALLFSLLFSLFLSGCTEKLESTYKEKDIPDIVRKICKEEYKLDVIAKRAENTLWIYAPLQRILHKDYGIKEDKTFDDDTMDKLRNILGTIGRVLISSDKVPEFFALVASDINVGIDYTIIANTMDIKKSSAEFIPWTEANRRYVTQIKLEPKAVGDALGSHVEFTDIKPGDFLAGQIAQRFAGVFQEESLKKFFKVNKAEGKFQQGVFIFEYSIEEVFPPPKKINIREEIIDTIKYCLQTYEFKDFETVEINNAIAQDRLILGREAILKNTNGKEF